MATVPYVTFLFNLKPCDSLQTEFVMNLKFCCAYKNSQPLSSVQHREFLKEKKDYYREREQHCAVPAKFTYVP